MTGSPGQFLMRIPPVLQIQRVDATVIYSSTNSAYRERTALIFEMVTILVEDSSKLIRTFPSLSFINFLEKRPGSGALNISKTSATNRQQSITRVPKGGSFKRCTSSSCSNGRRMATSIDSTLNSLDSLQNSWESAGNLLQRQKTTYEYTKNCAQRPNSHARQDLPRKTTSLTIFSTADNKSNSTISNRSSALSLSSSTRNLN